MKARVPGIDFASALMGRLSLRGGSVFLFGAKPAWQSRRRKICRGNFRPGHRRHA
jgi:UDP-N-acetyl-D-mannosaminuronic acid transferase (WecB/TagA/CpsF family)